MKQPIYLIPLLLILGLFSCKGRRTLSQLPAQQSPSNTEPSPTPSAALLGNEADQAIRLDSTRIRTEISGNYARTYLDMVFFNPNDRQLEGKFFFPLGDGQSIASFALEIEGKMRPAVVVEEEKGRVAYEGTLRQNIDPAILEYAGGNVFRARIFPLPAGGHKRIQLSYEEVLSPGDEGMEYVFRPPFKKEISFLKQEIKVQNQSEAPQIFHPFLSVLEKKDRSLTGFYQSHDQPLPPFRLSLSLPKESLTLMEEGKEGETWFHSLIKLPFYRKNRLPPRSIRLLWDASLSARQRARQKEFDLIRAYLSTHLDKKIHVKVSPFDQAYRESFEIDIKGMRDIETLIAQLEMLPADGGSDLSLLDSLKVEEEEVWLFSDGISTLGNYENISFSKALYAFVSSPRQEIPILGSLCRESRGRLINLQELSTSKALDQLDALPLRFLGAEYPRGEVRDIFPVPGSIAGSFFSLSGRVLSDQSQLTLRFGYGNQAPFVYRLTLDKLTQLTSVTGIDRRWARDKMAFLLEKPLQNRDGIRQLGQKFSLVSPGNSLIVLDRLEDYIANEIPPPEDMKEAYELGLAEAKKSEVLGLKNHLDKLADEFLSRQVWWETRFSIPQGPYIPDPEKKELEPELQEEVAGVSVDDSSIDLLQKEKENAEGDSQVNIRLDSLPLNAPYMDSLRKYPGDQQEAGYHELKSSFGLIPSFFLDMGDYFWKKEKKALALRIVSNLAELELSNHENLRSLAYRYLQWKRPDLALPVLEKVLRIRGEEPQSYRDLGIVHDQLGHPQEALKWLYEVVKKPWDKRFPEIGVLAAHEMNALIGRTHVQLSLQDIDPRFLVDMPCDLRVVMSWDADAVDLDLWVTDPRGEKCYYQSRLTEIGGRMSQDFRGGYGPEEFLIRRAMKGEYKVEANYYGNRRQSLSGPATLFVKIIRNYGQKNQQSSAIMLRLTEEAEVISVCQIEFE